MITAIEIATRIRSYRRHIGGETLVRYGLATFAVDGRVEKSTDRFVDALASTLETGETTEVIRWARTERADTASFELRELAHAACMAVGAEVAQSFRGSFRDVMSVLRRVEADIATALRSAEPSLEAIAA